MAIMWPRILPPDILSSTLRSTECDVYRRLEAALDETFIVFYSRPWLGIKPDGEEIDGECDFVIAHPEFGFLAIEVKGGAVAYDPQNDRWTSTDRHGIVHYIKNPVKQARTSKHQLLGKLKASPEWQSRRINARHGVILPHSSRPPKDLGADMPLSIFCFINEYENNLGNWILTRFGVPQEHDSTDGPLGHDGIRALEMMLAMPFRLHLPLWRNLADDEKTIHTLTQQQFHILRSIEDVERAAVSGGAGTGKTVLAVEESKRFAASGKRTLFTCFNRPLAAEIRRRLGNVENLLIANFHDLCAQLTREAGIRPPPAANQSLLFDEIYPEMLIQAMDILPRRRFDAVIVDEGQDFLPIWWIAIESILDRENPARLRVFLDSNQRVYGSADRLPRDIQLVPIRLVHNLRNTRRIHEAAIKHYHGFQIESLGPDGMAVEWAEASSIPQMRLQIEKRILRLVNLERVPPDEIVLLAESNILLQQIAPANRIGSFLCVPCDKPEDNHIVVDTIRRFKGLERSVVILAVTPDLVREPELIYVSLSRPRTLLVLIGDAGSLELIRNPASTIPH